MNPSGPLVRTESVSALRPELAVGLRLRDKIVWDDALRAPTSDILHVVSSVCVVATGECRLLRTPGHFHHYSISFLTAIETA